VRAAVGAGLTAICLVNVTEFANWGLGVNPHYSIRGGLADTAAISFMGPNSRRGSQHLPRQVRH
jgi:hypothetical protein